MKFTAPDDRGFSLTELLMTVALIGTVAAISVPLNAVFGIARLMTDAWAGMQVGWLETTTVLANAWTTFIGLLKKGWNHFAGFFQKVWARIKGLFTDSDAEAEIARINADVVKVLKAPELKEKLFAVGAEAVEQLAAGEVATAAIEGQGGQGIEGREVAEIAAVVALDAPDGHDHLGRHAVVPQDGLRERAEPVDRVAHGHVVRPTNWSRDSSMARSVRSTWIRVSSAQRSASRAMSASRIWACCSLAVANCSPPRRRIARAT